MVGQYPDEGGESLLELIIAVAILGLGVVALLGGLATAVLTSGTHRNQANVSSVLTVASERVKSAPYKKCANRGEYLDFPAPFPYAGPAPGFTIADWNGVSFVDRNAIGCDQLDQLGYREQLITLTVVSPDGKVRQTLPVVKRYRECPNPASPTPGCDSP